MQNNSSDIDEQITSQCCWVIRRLLIQMYNCIT